MTSLRNKLSDKTDLMLRVLLCGGILAFILYPVLCIFRWSVFIDGQFTLDAYRQIAGQSAVLLRHSFFTASLSALLSTAFAVLVAVKISMTTGKRRIFYMLILLMTMVSPPFLSSLTYLQLYGRRGWITYRLLHLSMNPYNKWGIIAMQSLHFASLNALFLIGFLNRTDKRILYASRDLGANALKTFVHTVLPVMRPAIAVSLVLSFVRSLADFGTPAIIGGKYSTMASEIYLQLIGYSKPERASAMNMMLLLPALAAFLLYRYLMKKSGDMQTAGGKGDESALLPIRFKGLPAVLLNLLVWFYYVLMILQYVCIFVSGFLKSRKGDYYFSLGNFDELFRYNVSSLLLSVRFSLIVAVFGTLFGMLIAYYLERGRIIGGAGWDFLVSLPYLLPGTCFGLGYILAFNGPPLKLTGTAAIIMLNMAVRQLPVVVRSSRAYVAQIPLRLEQAASDLGASRLSVMKDIVFPNLKDAFVTGFIYNFTSSMTTAGAVMFLISARYKVAVYTLFDAINGGEYGVASLLSSMMILITVAVCGAVMLLFGRTEEIRRRLWFLK